MNEAYTALSKVYERLIADDRYKKWANHVVEVLDGNTKGKFGFDLACGSGYFTRAIKKAGYKVTGVDISADMLSQAQLIAGKENLNIPFMKQDMTSFKSFEKADFLTIINDGVNYVSPERLEKAFASFYKNLNVGGVLFFDFSTEYKLKNIIGDNLFGEDYDETLAYPTVAYKSTMSCKLTGDSDKDPLTYTTSDTAVLHVAAVSGDKIVSVPYFKVVTYVDMYRDGSFVKCNYTETSTYKVIYPKYRIGSAVITPAPTATPKVTATPTPDESGGEP